MMNGLNTPIRCLADTNILVRCTNPVDPQYPLARGAVDRLLRTGATIAICPQNLVEFQALATRPATANGLGLTVAEASTRARLFELAFSLLPETPDIYPTWRRLVDSYTVIGRNVYDARIVAVMLVYEVATILTLNPSDFRRYSEIRVIEPDDMLV
jgi:predicted nucleic acid-binding protein